MHERAEAPEEERCLLDEPRFRAAVLEQARNEAEERDEGRLEAALGVANEGG